MDHGVGISVALITYNGSRYLEEQLASIAQQTRLPDEVVIVDDGSTDGTVGIARVVLSQYSLRARIEVNDERLGAAKNAERALSLTTGALVFLADQDDVWEPSKVERVAALADTDDDIDLVFTDALLIDSSGMPLGRRLWDAVDFSVARRDEWAEGGALDVLLRRPVVTGATVALRRRLLELALPVPGYGLHDEWLAFVAAATGRRMIGLPEPLLRYRVHSSNLAGTPTLNPVTRLRDHARGWRKRQDVLEQQEEALRRFSEDLQPEVHEKITRSVEFRRRRQSLPPSRLKRLNPVVRDTFSGNYRRFARGATSALFDIAAPAMRR